MLFLLVKASAHTGPKKYKKIHRKRYVFCSASLIEYWNFQNSSTCFGPLCNASPWDGCKKKAYIFLKSAKSALLSLKSSFTGLITSAATEEAECALYLESGPSGVFFFFEHDQTGIAVVTSKGKNTAPL